MFFFVCVCFVKCLLKRRITEESRGGGVQLFLLTAVLNQPLRKKKVNSLTPSYLSMNFVFQEK